MSGVPSVDWVALAAPCAVVLALLVVLVLDAVVGGRHGRRAGDAVALLGLAGAATSVGWLLWEGAARSTLCVPGADAVTPACSYTASGLTLTLQAVVLLGAVGCLLLALDGPGAADRAPHHVLFLSAVTGALVLAGARDLPTLVVALETASLPAIGLVALRRDAQGAQGGVTFLLTAVASLGLLLTGVALLYLATGQMHLDRVATALATPGLGDGVTTVAVLGMLFAVAGIGFKLSAVPFHLWTPDTYAGAPLPVAAFLAIVSKTAGLAGLVVLLAVGLAPLASTWGPVVAVIAVLTVTVGNLVALRQQVAIRLLAWSTVAQAGWVLLPLGAARDLGSTRDAVAASAGYLLAYAAASLAVFAAVVLLARHHPAGEEHTLEAYRGLARREPVAAAVLAFGLACLAGLPPGVMGLVAKVVAVRPLVDGELWWVAAVAAVNVVLGLAYYLRWGALLVSTSHLAPVSWTVRPAEGLVLGGAAALCVALSVYPQVLAGVLPGVLR